MLAPLRLMTAQQAAFDPAVRARVHEGGFNVVASRRAAAFWGGSAALCRGGSAAGGGRGAARSSPARLPPDD
jgi:hypothetical protein